MNVKITIGNIVATTRFEELYGLIEKPDEELRYQYMSMMNY